MTDGVAAFDRSEYNVSLILLLPLASRGDPIAQVYIGKMYDAGLGVLENHSEAVKWFRRAAEQGNADAQFFLGESFASGRGVPKDLRQALAWYRLSAEQGAAGAQATLGRMYEMGQGVPAEPAESAKWYRRAAEQGVAEAQASLGRFYRLGIGVSRNYAESFKWYLRAAEQQNADGEAGVARMYHQGLGIPKNHAEAFKWYGRAAPRGHTEAQAGLGQMYHLGEGIAHDYFESEQWYNRARFKGNLTAISGLCVLLFDHFSRNDVVAHHYCTLASTAGDARMIEIKNKLRIRLSASELSQSHGLTAISFDAFCKNYSENPYNSRIQNYLWCVLAELRLGTAGAEIRNRLETRMTALEIEEARRLAAAYFALEPRPQVIERNRPVQRYNARPGGLRD
jgi:TPR repeat protein